MHGPASSRQDVVIFYVILWRLKYEERCLDYKQSVVSNVPHVSKPLDAPGRLRGWLLLSPRMLSQWWLEMEDVCFKAIFISSSWCKHV